MKNSRFSNRIRNIICLVFIVAFHCTNAYSSNIVQQGINQQTNNRSKQVCDFQTARRVTIENALLSPNNYIGKCIRIRGYFGGIAIYDRPQNSINHRGAGHRNTEYNRIGIYADDNLLERLKDSPRYRSVEFLGHFSTCAHENEKYTAQNPDKVVFWSGYCHYNSDGYIYALDYRN